MREAFKESSMVSFGQEIIATGRDGSRMSYVVSGCDSQDTAELEVIRLARKDGWTYPRWWQYWRASDSRPEFARHAALAHFTLG
jgi:hypothetical protein